MIRKNMNKKIVVPFAFMLLLTLGLTACDQGGVFPNSSSELSSSDSSESSSENSSSSSSSSSEDKPTYPTNAYGTYYENCLTWTNGSDLKTKLSTAIHLNFVGQKYDAVWTTNQEGDQSFDNLDMVDQLYTDDDILKTRTKGSGDQTGWDREHCFAKTLIAGSNPSTSTIGPLTDFHNLFASWTTANNSRSNKNFGTVETSTGTIGYNKYDETTFEPGSDQDKGKVARAIFYMATMYSEAPYGLFLRESTCGTGDKCHGNLSSLLNWNLNSVTRIEYQHNLAVLNYQFNRNPFVDYPELVDYVFGSKQNEPGELKYLEPTISKLNLSLTSLCNYAVLNAKYEFTVGESFSKTDSLKVVGVNYDFSKTSALPTSSFILSGASDGEIFTTASTKTIIVQIGDQTISYPINITQDPVGAMSWKHPFVKADFNGAPGTINTMNIDGKQWTELRANAAATYTATNNKQGPQLGSATTSVNAFTLANVGNFTYDSKTLIKKIGFEGSVAANTTATLVFKVNGTQIGTTQTLQPNTSGYNTYIVTLDTAISGTVSIEITNIAKALYVYRIGVQVE